ncbi:MAG TPA: glycine betaine ABC transporter substrate-binding protein, partial [Candidatus Thermoplasmatota archaeon]|nr:glycine betaine ABC transporter substrate-binding protein [Candidatus Thermoplasmatota archaeon]
MMQVAKDRTALDVYGLADWEIVDASTPAMLAAYDDAVQAGEWIVIMMWSPHFAYAKWSGDQAVTDLADPGDVVDGKTMYLYKDQADAARINTLVTAGFEEKHPDVAAFLKRFQVTAEEEALLMLEVNEGKSVRDVAYAYLDANPQKVQAWLGR